MPLDPTLVGRELGRLDVRPDARWLMAYAAGVPDERPELYETRAALVTHPLFPVAPEWELLITSHSTPRAMPRSESVRGVHYAHDVIVERSLRPDDELVLTATVIGVDRRRAGATQDVVFHAVDASGATVWRTRMTSLFRGVALVGEPVTVDVGWPEGLGEPDTVAPPRPLAQVRSHVRSVDAHVYTECARIWNPIHTDTAVAEEAGLHAPILHGTATLARAVSLVTGMAGVPLADVRRVSGRFAAMVDLDTTVTVRLLHAGPTVLRFDVVNGAGLVAVVGGAIGVGAVE